MRKIAIEGTKTKLSERDYKQLLERFDVENTEDGIGSTLIIKRPCICRSYDYIKGQGCKSCPFDIFDKTGEGCIQMLHMLSLRPAHAMLCRNTIYWAGGSDFLARHEITAIRDWLLGLEKVR